MADGAYAVGVSDGWVATAGMGGDKLSEEFVLANQLTGNTDEDADEDDLNLLNIDVTPSTGVLYGRVSDQNGVPAEGVTVDVNGQSAETDEFGRYIVDGFSKKGPPAKNPIVVTASGTGYGDEEREYDAEEKANKELKDFEANTPVEFDFSVDRLGDMASISGTVTASGTADRDFGCADQGVRFGFGSAQPEREIARREGE